MPAKAQSSRAVVGREFYKMCGSGNDFVVFDGFAAATDDVEDPGVIRALCARGTGVGADGIVVLEPPGASATGTAFVMRYYNRDGSRASLCGNAALCVTRLAVELGHAPAAGFHFATDAGPIAARLRDGQPEIDVQPIRELRADAELVTVDGERRVGFAIAGVPHLVLDVADIEAVSVRERGAELRHAPSLADGANVNFIAPVDGGWRMRTYERGVEDETLACGTGAVACSAILRAWGTTASDRVTIWTSSGQPLVVTHPASPDIGPSLSGEGRIVFQARLSELG